MGERSVAMGLIAGLLLGGLAPAEARAAGFIPLGELPGGGVLSQAHDISDDGSTVVGASDGPGGREAFVWTWSGGLQSLGELPGGSHFSSAQAVSADGGAVVGYSASAAGSEAFRWTSGSGMIGLGGLPNAYVSSFATGVTADGTKVVGRATSQAFGSEAFLWEEGVGMQGLGGLSEDFELRDAAWISPDGTMIVGGGVTAEGYRALVWDELNGFESIGLLPGGSLYSYGEAATSDGSVVVGHSDSALAVLGEPLGEAFRVGDGTGLQALGDLPGGIYRSLAQGVSDDGSIVVGFSTSADSPSWEAFIWDETHGLRSLKAHLESEGLDLTGWHLTNATGISADGHLISGYGGNPEGQLEAFVAVVPEPSAPLGLGLGVAMLARGARARRREGRGQRTGRREA